MRLTRSTLRPGSVHQHGIRRIGRGLGTLDREIFDAVAESPSPLLDAIMPRLTSAADHSKLWLGLAAALGASGHPSLRRGAARGVIGLAVTSALTNQVAKRVWRRPRPNHGAVPLVRLSRRMPTSNSLPSGHSASAAAFAVGVGLETAPVGLALTLLAGLVGLSRVATGAHYPGDVFAGFGIGAAVSVLGGRIVPPIVPSLVPEGEPLRADLAPRPDGAGVILVVNPASGSGTGARVIEEVRRELPGAEIVEIGAGDEADETSDAESADESADEATDESKVSPTESALRDAAARAEVLAVGGGDGTVSAAARIAVENGLPLAVFPAGTFNHFAKDVGCETVGQTIAAIRAGTAEHVDVVRLNDDAVLLNTASIGAYPAFVRRRERLEHKIGKPLAGAYAMLRTLRRNTPVRIRYDDVTLWTSVFFLGNSIYLPSGFAPARRLRMDDGLLDVRILETGPRLATLRVVFALMLGRLERSPLYRELRVPRFAFRALDGPTTVAVDGEVGPALEEARFTVDYRALTVYRRPR